MSMFKVISINRHRITVDGEGVTTLIGLSGCPLNCKYCINKNALTKAKVQKIQVLDLIKEVMMDYCYFIGTDGGVCFGGGEPLLQYDSLIEFMEQSKVLFKTTIETSLNIQVDLKTLLELVSELIIDIKSTDNTIYKKYTTLDNNILLLNLSIINELGMQSKCKIRIPSIKGFTTLKDIEESKKFVTNLGFSNIDTFEYVV